MRILLALCVIGAVGWLTPAWSAEEQVVQQVSGNGTRTLRPFKVANNWEVRWDLKGESLEFYVVNATDKKDFSIGPTASQDKPGKGATYRQDGGEYFLRVLGKGDWTITVVQLP